MVLLIDGWYDLHKATNKRTESYLWPISYSKFIEMLCPNIEKDIYRSSYYHVQAKMDFNDLKDYLLREEFKEQHLELLKNYVLIGQKKGALDKIKNHLTSLLKRTTAHDSLLCEKIIEEFELSADINAWTQSLYHYIYFSISDRLHKDMALNKYRALTEDLLEYNKKVTMSYGTSGYPGMLQLYSLANREQPNIIALYEMGELEYYGKGPSGKINYESAFTYYLRTLELSDSHPLALWSIAYMKYNYGSKNSVLKYGTVPKLDEECINGKRRFWYEDIINKVDESYAYGCGAAANLIGQIIASSDEKFPEKYKGKYRHETSERYFKESADSGYIYGCNNYYAYCKREAAKSDSEEKKCKLIKESIKYLSKSANSGEPWASNKLGNYYRKGLTVNDEEVIPQCCDKAYQCYSNAIIMSTNRRYFWPLINLSEHFFLNKNSKYYGIKSQGDLQRLIRDALDNLDITIIKEREQIEALKKMLKYLECQAFH